MDFYTFIKTIHISCAILSISGFLIRGLLMLQRSPYLEYALTKRLPHVIDTLLLASALMMITMSAQYPFELPWLTAKVTALVMYILLGMVALKWGKTRRMRLLAWLMAIMVFAYIVAVAMTRSVWPFLV